MTPDGGCTVDALACFPGRHGLSPTDAHPRHRLAASPRNAEHPNREFLAERFERFRAA